jgi:hypothetical protein
MKKLSFEKMENLSGGCGIDEMMFYATMVTYYAQQGNTLASGYYLGKLYACM